MSSGFSSKLWRMRTIPLTVIATLLCMAGSSLYAFVVFQGSDPEALRKAVVSALILPVFVGAPAYYSLIRRWRALHFKNLRLSATNVRDGLTHCLNQTAFKRSVEGVLDLHPKVMRRGALLVIDADKFKLINDMFGHDIGDEALKIIAERIRSTTRRGDIVGRIGGEEFAVFLHDVDFTVARRVAERIRSAVDLAEFIVDGERRSLSVSVGVVVFDQHVGFVELFKQADHLLYEAKSAGRNRVEIGAVAPALAA